MTDESVVLEDDVHSRDVQRLVWDAMEGLNTGERAALELNLRQGLDGADLAAALGVSRANATKLLQRARTELDRSLGALILARGADGTCPALGQLVEQWDGRLTPLLRKRLGRHIDSCEICATQRKHRVNASAVLAAIPLLAAPVGLRQLVIEHDRTAMVSYDRRLVRRAWAFDRDGFPDERGARRRAVGAGLAGSFCLVLALLAVVVPRHTHHAALPLPSASSSSSSSAATSSTAPPSTSAKKKPPERSTSASSAPSSSVAPPPPSSPSTSTTTSRRSSSTTPPPKVTFGITPTTLKFPAATGGTQQLTLTATSGSVAWSAKDSAGLLKLSAYSGTTKASVSVTAQPEKALTSDTIIFTWSGGTTSVTVTWS